MNLAFFRVKRIWLMLAIRKALISLLALIYLSGCSYSHPYPDANSLTETALNRSGVLNVDLPSGVEDISVSRIEPDLLSGEVTRTNWDNVGSFYIVHHDKRYGPITFDWAGISESSSVSLKEGSAQVFTLLPLFLSDQPTHEAELVTNPISHNSPHAEFPVFPCGLSVPDGICFSLTGEGDFLVLVDHNEEGKPVRLSQPLAFSDDFRPAYLAGVPFALMADSSIVSGQLLEEMAEGSFYVFAFVWLVALYTTALFLGAYGG